MGTHIWIQFWALPLIKLLHLGKKPNFSMPQFPLHKIGLTTHPPHADVVRGKGENAGERFAKLPGSDGCDCFPGGSTLLGVGFQVRFLEQQNQVLETKWGLLQQLDLNNC